MASIERKNISLVMPAYNEEENIKEAISICEKFFSSLPLIDFEIIVVNDGSLDKTGEILDDLKKTLPRLRVFHHPKNQGMGKAIKTGVGEARSEFIFVTPSDLQFDIREFEAFLPYLDKNDLVIGYRLNRDYNSYRRFNTALYLFLINLLFSLNVQDPSWVKLFRKRVFEEAKVSSNGFFWDVEFLIKAKRNGHDIKEIGTHSFKRKKGKSSGGNLFRVLKTFFRLLQFWLDLRFKNE